MSVVVVRSPLVDIPQSPARVRQDLRSNVILAWLAGSGAEMRRDSFGRVADGGNGGFDPSELGAASISGRGIGYSNVSGGAFRLTDAVSGFESYVQSSGELTFIASIDGVGEIGANPGFWRNGTGSSGSTFFIANGATRRPWVRVNGSNILQPGSGPQWPLGANLTFVLRLSAKNVDVWWEGQKQHSATHSETLALTGTDGVCRIGWQSSSGERITGSWIQLAFLDRWIGDTDAAEISANPAALYEPDECEIWLDGAASSGIPSSLNVAASNITSSGARATVTLVF